MNLKEIVFAVLFSIGLTTLVSSLHEEFKDDKEQTEIQNSTSAKEVDPPKVKPPTGG